MDKFFARLEKYKGLIFDLDGVILDLNVDWKKVKQELKDYCHKKKNVSINFNPLDEKLIYAETLFGKQFYLELVQIVSKFETNQSNYIINKKLLNYINSIKNRKIAIYSMNTQKCLKKIIRKYFKHKPDFIISKETCAEPKPTEKDLLFLINYWHFKKREVIFVGSSKKDKLSGQMAGISTYILDKIPL